MIRSLSLLNLNIHDCKHSLINTCASFHIQVSFMFFCDDGLDIFYFVCIDENEHNTYIHTYINTNPIQVNRREMNERFSRINNVDNCYQCEYTKEESETDLKTCPFHPFCRE